MTDSTTASDNSSRRLIRILLADDHEVVREGLAAILRRREIFDVVGEVSDGAAAVEAWRELRPDITLCDLRMPKLDGVGTIAAIRAIDCHARIIILTTYDSDEDIYQGLRAGAKGYLLKDTPRDQIVDAIVAVHAGRTFIPSIVGEKLATRMVTDQLTDKETAILRYVAVGRSNKEIARELDISEGTVKFHTNAIYSKLGVASRTEAISVAAKRGLIKID
jgi:two-component system, NarL family, response regulator